jgi:hypothetical protein
VHRLIAQARCTGWVHRLGAQARCTGWSGVCVVAVAQLHHMWAVHLLVCLHIGTGCFDYCVLMAA